LAQLRQERLIGYSHEDYPEYFDFMSRLFKPFPFNPASVEEYDSATGLIAAVEAGRGIALVSASMKCLAGPRVKLLPLTPPLPPLALGALSTQSTSRLTERFIDAVKQVA
jgi:DNA-binding transcriptional LysR family regulator